MKLFIAFFTVMFSIQAQATTPKRFTEVSLDVISISDASPLAGEDIMNGYMVIDHMLDSVTITLQPNMPACPTGQFCAMVMPAPIVIDFADLRARQDACGSVVYTNVVETSINDQLVEYIEIIDNTFNLCHHLHVLDQYHVTYSTYAPRSGVTSEAQFRGPSENQITLPVQPHAAM